MLRGHIFKEQDGVFPAALASLTAADWEIVDAARARAVGAQSLSAPDRDEAVSQDAPDALRDLDRPG